MKERTLAGVTYSWDPENPELLIRKENDEIKYYQEGVGEITKELYKETLDKFHQIKVEK